MRAAPPPATAESASRPWRFFTLVFAWCWAFWIAAALAPCGIVSPAVAALLYLGGIAPAVVALVLTWRARHTGAWRAFWARVFGVRRIPFVWFVVVLLLPAVLVIAGGVVAAVTAGEPMLDLLWLELPAPAWRVVPLAIFLLVFGPVPEELGWRGYALDGLQASHGAVLASLILGAVWGVWHLPLFFIENTYHHGLGVATPEFWLFLAALLPQSVLFTWVYNNTRRSILAAILLHFAINFTGELLGTSRSAQAWTVILTGIMAAGVMRVWGSDLSGGLSSRLAVGK